MCESIKEVHIYIHIYNIFIRGVNINALMHAINVKIITRIFFCALIALEGLTPISCRHHSKEGYEDTVALQRTIARVAAQQSGYFENSITGKTTEPWVAVFWGY